MVDYYKYYKDREELKAKFDKHTEDLEFERRVADAWERYDRGEFKSLSKEKFLKELDKW